MAESTPVTHDHAIRAVDGRLETRVERNAEESSGQIQPERHHYKVKRGKEPCRRLANSPPRALFVMRPARDRPSNQRGDNHNAKREIGKSQNRQRQQQKRKWKGNCHPSRRAIPVPHLDLRFFLRGFSHAAALLFLCGN